MHTPVFENLPPMPEPPAMRLLHDQVLVEPIRKSEKFEAKSASGLLFLPDNPERDKKAEFFWWGRVVLTGPGDRYRYRTKQGREGQRTAYSRNNGERFPMDVKPGDMVLYERRQNADFEIDGRTWSVLHETQHIALIFASVGECA